MVTFDEALFCASYYELVAVLGKASEDYPDRNPKVQEALANVRAHLRTCTSCREGLQKLIYICTQGVTDGNGVGCESEGRRG